MHSYIWTLRLISFQCLTTFAMATAPCMVSFQYHKALDIFDGDTHSVNDLYRCYNLCWYLKSCKSAAFSPSTSSCELHSIQSGTNNVKDRPGQLFMNVNSPLCKVTLNACANRPCGVNEICVPVEASASRLCLPKMRQAASTTTPGTPATSTTTPGTPATSTTTPGTTSTSTTTSGTTSTSTTTEGSPATSTTTSATATSTTTPGITTTATSTTTPGTTTTATSTTTPGTTITITTPSTTSTTTRGTTATSTTTSATATSTTTPEITSTSTTTPATTTHPLMTTTGKACPTSSGYTYEASIGLCYKIHTDRKYWSTARPVCQAEGADLIVLHDNQVMAFILQKMEDLYPGMDYYVGADDRDQDGVWTWVDGTPLGTKLGPKRYCSEISGSVHVYSICGGNAQSFICSVT